MKPYKNLSLVDMSEEIWVNVYGFDDIFEVSNFGRIKSLGRYVPIRNGQRWVKERIRKQTLGSKGRLTCPLSVNCISYSINLPAIVFKSFNRKKTWDTSIYCIMHINKVITDNRLSNLRIETISKSHSINAEKGLLPHLIENNRKKAKHRLSLIEKTCRSCGKTKSVKNFEEHRFVCIPCRKEQRRKHHLKTYKRKNEL